MDKWEGLRKALEGKVTQGAWRVAERPYNSEWREYERIVMADTRGGIRVCDCAETGSAQENARYIAAANPSAIADLLAERDRLAAHGQPSRCPRVATPFPMNVYLRDEAELRAFLADNAQVRAILADRARVAGSDTVPMPCNADMAAAMALVGIAWLKENAPERLSENMRDALAAGGGR